MFPTSTGRPDNRNNVRRRVLVRAVERANERIAEEGGCDRIWPEKDWIQFAMNVAEGTETIEAFDEANDIISAFFALWV